ncbi:MAG: cytochrome c-type biogenesis protein CcmH [Nannocystaceae bacterium]
MTLLAFADPDQVLQELSTDLMSPYCPGRTIAACPSPQARQLEDHILAEAKSGKTRDEIEQELVARFGDEMVGYAPQPLLLYGSALVGLLALVAVVMVGRRWSKTSRSTAAAGAGGGAPTAAELERLEDALDEVDEF